MFRTSCIFVLPPMVNAGALRAEHVYALIFVTWYVPGPGTLSESMSPKFLPVRLYFGPCSLGVTSYCPGPGPAISTLGWFRPFIVHAGQLGVFDVDIASFPPSPTHTAHSPSPNPLFDPASSSNNNTKREREREREMSYSKSSNTIRVAMVASQPRIFD